ncbi:MAG: ATPase, T2SS/T4P/T4SS family, partial [Patescibacteria group bacterium]
MDYKKEFEELILTLMREGASDLHIGALKVPAIRVAGELIFLAKHPEMSKEDVVGILSEVLDEKKLEKFFKDKEVDFSYDFRGEMRLRGNAFFQKNLISVAFRLVPKVKTLTDLHLPAVLADIARKKQGFFLVVGPVGQGKSTTLSAMVNLINSEQARHIVTIEDPIEYMFTP